jgi:hypothetical protein
VGSGGPPTACSLYCPFKATCGMLCLVSRCTHWLAAGSLTIFSSQEAGVQLWSQTP